MEDERVLAKLNEIGETEDECQFFHCFMAALFEFDLSLTTNKEIESKASELLERFAGPECALFGELEFYGCVLGVGEEDDRVHESFDFHIQTFERNIAFMRKNLPNRKREMLSSKLEDLSRWLENAERLRTIFENNSLKAINLEQRIASLEESADASKREYITILGIFAAIVVAFTAGVSFSGSALQNIGSASPYKLGLVLIPMALFLMDLVGLLIVFLIEVVGKVKKKAFYLMLGVGNGVLLLLFMLDIFFGPGLSDAASNLQVFD